MEMVTLDPEPSSVPVARRFVRSWFATRGLDSFAAELLTSELVGNVVRHTSTRFTVGLTLDGRVRIEVHDGAAATEAFRASLYSSEAMVPTNSPGGRGLPLVRQLAASFGLSDEPGLHGGKVVWFEVEPAAAAS
jgi:anti-sigma regulatory factor (Ser/Thr protein kinase)